MHVGCGYIFVVVIEIREYNAIVMAITSTENTFARIGIPEISFIILTPRRH